MKERMNEEVTRKNAYVKEILREGYELIDNGDVKKMNWRQILDTATEKQVALEEWKERAECRSRSGMSTRRAWSGAGGGEEEEERRGLGRRGVRDHSLSVLGCSTGSATAVGHSKILIMKGYFLS
eukprot:750004-Hanusia_phi.AAC.2